MMHQQQPGQEGTRTGYPKWWKDDMTSGWDRAKAAIKRDWEQTKHDLSGGRKGVDLDQNVGDTVKQTAGKDTGTKGTFDKSTFDFDRNEESVRYGYGAAHHYSDYKDWDDKLEGKLKEEWNDLKSGRSWDDVKYSVRHGFSSARRNIH